MEVNAITSSVPTTQEALTPEAVVAVITDTPGATAVTRPSPSTVATLSSEDVQVRSSTSSFMEL